MEKIAIIGLGYVGLPLATAFSKHYKTVGFDINDKRIKELRNCIDTTLEVSQQELQSAENLFFESDPAALNGCDFIIVTVPTPIDRNKQPDMTPLLEASKLIARHIEPGTIVIFESTVYPGATEEVCVPIIEQESSLKFNSDFFVGYSPERINPGDKTHRLESIIKVTSGSTPRTAERVDNLYKTIIKAGTHKTSSIKVAEAAKVIENTQRDLNIALINELAMIFDRVGIDTHEVLKAAGTKWNFLKFYPGLVGGHCIGVDPYYLTHKAEELGYRPEVILAGRRTNDNMPQYVVSKLIKCMLFKKIMVNGSNVLVLGITFKEDCPDIRNTKVVDIVKELEEVHANVDIYDPCSDSDELKKEYGLETISDLHTNKYDAVIIAVAHKQFVDWKYSDLKKYLKKNSVTFDLKNVFPMGVCDLRL